MSSLRDMEQLFLHTDHRVVAAYPAVKCEPSRSQGRGQVPQPGGSARVLCLTVQRRSSAQGFKASLHVCKQAPGQAPQVRRSLRLKLLARLEAFSAPGAPAGVFELTFIQRGLTGGESRLAFEVRSDAARQELLASLYAFCKSHEKRTPVVAGLRLSDLDPDNESDGSDASGGDRGGAAKPTGAARAAALAAAAAGGAPRPAAAGQAAAEADAAASWATREDTQLAGLLDAVTVGASSVEELRARLAAELSALEDANVHDVLGSAAAAERALGELSSSLGLLDDLDESLAMFDAKLRHMRGDIQAIEGRNNQLEARSRNSAALARALGGLAGALELAPGAEEALRAREFNASNLDAVVAAAWDLHRHLEALSSADPPAATEAAPLQDASSLATSAGLASCPSDALAPPPHVPSALQGMAAVGSRRRQLQGLAQIFLDRATDYLARELQHIADADLQAAGALHDGARLRLAPHAGLHQRCAQLGALLQAVAALRPGAAGPLRDHYCRAVNALLLKETGGAGRELLKRAAAGEAAGGGAEPELLFKGADSVRALERISSVPARAAQGGGAAAAPAGVARTHSAQVWPAPHREGGSQLQHCYAEGLAVLLPLLAAEAEACTSAVCGGASSADAEAAVAALLQGTDAPLLALVDCLKPSRALPCLPMLAATLAWQARLAGRGAAAPLLAALRRCEQRLRAVWEQYVLEQAAAIKRFDGRAGLNVPGMNIPHVLPVVVSLEAVARRVEALVDECARPEIVAGSSWTGALPPPAAAGAAAAAPRPPPLQLRPSPFESAAPPPPRHTAADSTVEEEELHSGPAGSVSFMSDSVETGSSLRTPGFNRLHGEASSATGPGGTAASTPGSVTGPEQAGAPSAAAPSTLPCLYSQQQQQQQQQQMAAPQPFAPAAAARAAADALFAAVLGATVAAIEQHAGAEPKHAARLRLENFAFLALALEGVVSSSSRGAQVLQRYCAEAAAQRDAALGSYVEQSLLELKVGRALQLGEAQPAGAPAEARQAAAAAAAGLDKRLLVARQRLQRHLAGSSPYLMAVVWERMALRCLGPWTALEAAAGAVLAPSAAELRAMFDAAAKAAAS